jgi:hypothetical protein
VLREEGRLVACIWRRTGEEGAGHFEATAGGIDGCGAVYNMIKALNMQCK